MYRLSAAFPADSRHLGLEYRRQRTSQTDLPPLKWSSLKYDFRMEDKIDGKEEAYG
jgi:hypothetical protein